MNIYYTNNSYPEKRCIIDKVNDYKYIPLVAAGKVDSLEAFIEKVQHSFAHRYSRHLGEKTLSCYWLLKRNGVVHTFNSCISGRNKWCATFETIIPRTNYTRGGMSAHSGIDKRTIQQFKLLAKDNCLGCMALSQAAYDLQMSALKKIETRLTEKELKAIQDKTIVLHPPQMLLVSQEEIRMKFVDISTLEMIFVGHDFFRKGGKELIDALMEYKGQYKFHLTVVSAINYGDYASQATYEEMIEYKELLLNEEWITFYENLPNEQVLELCKKAHIGFLPTFADTYGYSVLEMQACGCAMLTTDIRALPEINNKECGWICHLSQNEMREALYQTEEERIVLKRELCEQLMLNIKTILEATSGELLNKALQSWIRIKEYHDPKKYEETLIQIMQ